MAMGARANEAQISRPVLRLGGKGTCRSKSAMPFGLKAGGAQMTVSKLFKSPEGREMVQCTWFDKKSRVHRAEFVMDSLEGAEATTRLRQGERA